MEASQNYQSYIGNDRRPVNGTHLIRLVTRLLSLSLTRSPTRALSRRERDGVRLRDGMIR